jgi:hypothetical protein
MFPLLWDDQSDGDDDADGVSDEDDLCPGTPMDVAHDSDGCSGTQYVDLVVDECSEYQNQGQYVKAVTQAANNAKASGLLSGKEKAAIVSGAAKESCE